MPAIVLRDLRARRPHNIGHRTLAQGEVLCRMQFRSDDDAKFFGNHLRWSAFELVLPEEPAAADAAKPATTAPSKVKSEKPKPASSAPAATAAPAPEKPAEPLKP